ncbi:MAG: AbrB/MazE/SpoVT family DNA-binding domain-containing protein [Nevskiales bacterium]
MEVKARMWGNSLAIRLPKSLAMDCGIKTGETLDVSAEHGRLVIRKSGPTLDELLAGITAGNLHGEVSFGSAAGKELL